MTPCLLRHQVYMCQLSSRNLKPWCKYSYILPAAKLKVYPQSWAPLLPLSVPSMFHVQSTSSPYLSSPYHSQLPSRPTSNVLELSSFTSPHMSPRWKPLPPRIVTHSSSSVFRRRYYRLWSNAELGVSLLFGLCEGHLYQCPSRPPNYLGLLK